MPFTVNGIGTRWYGKRDFCEDGSYSTTEWITVFYLPTVPLYSVRLKCLGRTVPRSFFDSPSHKQYLVLSRSRPNLRQVASVYGYTVAMVMLFVLIPLVSVSGLAGFKTSIVVSQFIVMLALIAVVPLPLILRRRAQRLCATAAVGHPAESTAPASAPPASKVYRLSPESIHPLAHGRGSCIATDMITVDGRRVGFMYRDPPHDEIDSGWVFTAGVESDDYMTNPDHLGIYNVNTIANYDPEIIAFLDAEAGSAFERENGTGRFIPVHDFRRPDFE